MSPSRSSKKRARASRRRTPPGSGSSPASAQAAEDLHGLEIEINHLRQLFRETHKEYGIAVESEIARMIEPIRENIEESGQEMTPGQQKILRQMVALVRKVNIRPEKGRRKDLKRIEETVAKLTTLVEKWQWPE